MREWRGGRKSNVFGGGRGGGVNGGRGVARVGRREWRGDGWVKVDVVGLEEEEAGGGVWTCESLCMVTTTGVQPPGCLDRRTVSDSLQVQVVAFFFRLETDR